MKTKKKKVKGVNVTVSPKAHKVMAQKSLDKGLKLREYVNIINNLPKEE